MTNKTNEATETSVSEEAIVVNRAVSAVENAKAIWANAGKAANGADTSNTANKAVDANEANQANGTNEAIVAGKVNVVDKADEANNAFAHTWWCCQKQRKS